MISPIITPTPIGYIKIEPVHPLTAKALVQQGAKVIRLEFLEDEFKKVEVE